MSIGIIISCYKQWEYMKAAIDSVMVQTYQDWHLYVINDEYSSYPYYDEHMNLPLQKQHKHRYKINYYFDGWHKGLSKRLNEGLKYCKEDYVILLGADDTIDPYYLENVAKHIEQNPGLIWMYGDCEISYQNKTNRMKIPVNERYNPGKFNRKKLQKINYIPCCSVVFDKTTIGQIGFNEKLTWAEDWEMWLLLSKFYKPHYLPFCAYTRNDETSVMRDLIGNSKWLTAKRRFKKWLIKRKFRSK